MTGTASVYPDRLDVFMPLVDGLHPIAVDDGNLLFDAMEKIEAALGYGVSDAGLYGPKSGNASVRARLDAFLDGDGSLYDVTLVTGTRKIGDFSELGPGAFIGFSKTLSGNNISVLFTALQEEQETSSAGTWANTVPTIVWIAAGGRFATGVTLQARYADGGTIPQNESREVKFAVLAFGPAANY